jgi:hypothetical protein
MTSNPQNITIDNTVLDTWFERDRASVILYLKDEDGDPGETIIEFWDGAVQEAIDDGFLNPRDFHRSAFEYAEQMGLLDPANRVKREPVPTGWVIAHDELGVLLTWRGGEMVWSSEASQEDLDKGATTFADEETAEDWFSFDAEDDEEADENAEFVSHLSYHEVVVDVTPQNHVRPSRVSMDALEKADIDICRAPTLKR